MSIPAEIMGYAFSPVDPRFIWMILRLQVAPTMLASQTSCEQAHVEQPIT
jgi:hypothetical protein